MAADFFLRPMRSDDIAAVERLTDDAFYDLDVRTHRPGLPAPERRPAARAEMWRTRLAHVLEQDPGGSWVAEDGAGVLGAAVSLKRELMWILASYAVRPGSQGRGVGKPLLDAALDYGRGCLRGMLSASTDPKAVRRYRLAGFTMHPHMSLRGSIDRSAIPVLDHVREGTAADIDLMNSVDRQVRAAAHGPDHELLVRLYPLLVIDRPTGSGYVYVDPGRRPELLAATNRRTATELLWAAIATTDPHGTFAIDHITPENEWAIDAGMAARMDLHVVGYLALRNMKPPAPYLAHGIFL